MRKDDREKLENHIKTKISRSPNLSQLSFNTYKATMICQALYESRILNYLQLGYFLQTIKYAFEDAQKKLIIAERILNNETI